MKLAHNVVTEKEYEDVGRHSNYNTIQQIIDCQDEIGFDGVYYNVFLNHRCLEGKKGVLFVMGNYIGDSNMFDLPNVPRLEMYCNWEQIRFLCTEYDFEIGWHTWSHPDLTTLTREEILMEITPPPHKLIRYFAYPYGRYNDLVIDCVKQVGYEAAWSVTQGSTNPHEKDFIFKQYRPYL